MKSGDLGVEENRGRGEFILESQSCEREDLPPTQLEIESSSSKQIRENSILQKIKNL